MTSTSRLSLTAVAVTALAAALSGCGMPQATAPDTPAPAAQAEPELMGGPELAPVVVAKTAPARRPGWGSMAPIPNPGEESETRMASAAAPYRVIGPSAPEAPAAQVRAQVERPVRPRERAMARARVQAGPTSWIQVEGQPSPAAKPRVRHWIVPVAQR